MDTLYKHACPNATGQGGPQNARVPERDGTEDVVNVLPLMLLEGSPERNLCPPGGPTHGGWFV